MQKKKCENASPIMCVDPTPSVVWGSVVWGIMRVDPTNDCVVWGKYMIYHHAKGNRGSGLCALRTAHAGVLVKQVSQY